MEVEYSGGGVLIFSYLILIHNMLICVFVRSKVEPSQLDTSEFIGCHFDGPPVACKRGLRLAS